MERVKLMTLRMGIIGVGGIGTVHAHCISKGTVAGMKLAAVCDISEQRRQAASTAFRNVPVFENAGDLIKSGLVDAVVIATPHYDHPTLAVPAFDAGLHVLTEKPAGVFVRQVREMNAAAEKSGKVFGIMFNQRTDPLFQKTREIVKSGGLGELKRFVWIVTNWYRTQYYYESGSWRATWQGEGGGVLMNQAPHNFDIWQWIFGMPKRVRGFCYNGKYHNIEVEDDATIYAEYENGATAAFITSTGDYPGTNRLEITGDSGKLVLENGELKHYKFAVPERKFCFSERVMVPDIPVEVDVFKPESAVQGHAEILRNFTDVCLNGVPLISPGKEGINQVKLSNAAYLSSWTDKWVEIDAPENEIEFEKHLNEFVANSSVKKAGAAAQSGDDYSRRWTVQW